MLPLFAAGTRIYPVRKPDTDPLLSLTHIGILHHYYLSDSYLCFLSMSVSPYSGLRGLPTFQPTHNFIKYPV